MTTCAEIRGLLPDYASGRLDDATGAVVAAHCALCAACAAERDWLMVYYRELRSLGEVKAPEDFLPKVRARLARPAPFTRIIQGLFMPSGRKIPLELAGVAATVVLLVAVFHLVRPVATPERRAAVSAPAATPALKTAWKEPARLREIAARPAAAQAQAPRRSARGMEVIAEDRLQAGREKRDESAVARRELKAAPLLAKAEERKDRGVIEIALLIPPREDRCLTASVSEEAFGRAAAPGMKAKRKSLAYDREAAEEKPLAEEETPETAGAGEPFDRVRSCVESAGGTIFLTDPDKATGRPTAVIAEVPARAYPGLLAALDRLGELRGTPQPVPAAAEGTVRVRIVVLPSR